MGNKGEETTEETSEKEESSPQGSEIERSVEKPESLDHIPVAEGKEAFETDKTVHVEAEETTIQEENKVHKDEEDGEHTESADETTTQNLDHGKDEHQLPETPVELPESPIEKFESSDSVDSPQEKEITEVGTLESPVMMQPMSSNLGDNEVEGSTSELGESHGISDVHENIEVETKEESDEEERVQAEESVERISSVQPEESGDTEKRDVERISSVQPEASGDTEKRDETDTSVLHSEASEETESVDQSYNERLSSASPPNESSDPVSEFVSHKKETTIKENERDHFASNVETDMKEQHLNSVKNMHDSDSMLELESVKREMKMMEAALQGAARQAQVFHIL